LGAAFACGCGAGLPCAFAWATGFFAAGLGAGFFAEVFFVAAGFFAAGFDAGRDFFVAGLGAGRFAAGFFALAAVLDFADDDLRTGFLAMGILTVTASSTRGRAGAAGRRPRELRATRENFKFYHFRRASGSGRPATTGGKPPNGESGAKRGIRAVKTREIAACSAHFRGSGLRNPEKRSRGPP
jgi:hypothetical protein